MNEGSANNGAVGGLTVRVITAGGALPLDEARVEISSNGQGVIQNEVRESNRNGLTETLYIPTPPASESRTSGYPTPYSLADITVSKDGFYTRKITKIPIFAGVNSVQPVEMVPIAPFESEDSAPDQPSPDSETWQMGGGL